ncbi:MAG: trigger factor [Armatimonadota bacterium]|nr:trigger factor [Armatimonadota bacterium]
MDVDVRELGGSRVALHVKLSADEVKGAFDRTYQSLSDRGGIRGFRPGKVPRKILDRYYDYDLIRGATYETLVQERLEEALDQEGLQPIEQLSIETGAPPDEEELAAERIRSGLAQEEEAQQPADPEELTDEELQEELKDIPLVEGEAFEFYSVFTTWPRPKLPDMDELSLKRPVTRVSDEEVEEQLEELRRLNIQEVEAEREEIADGDLVVADVKVVVEGEDPAEVEATEQDIEVGNREYLADLDQKLIGHTAGDVVEAQFEYDQDHPDEDLAGRSARIIAEIHSFSARELPELTDEFARSLGDYESLEDLRRSIREQLQEQYDEQAEEELRGQVMRYVMEGTEIELPEQFVEEAAERSHDQLRDELQQMGMSVDELAEAVELDPEELRENQRARAESALKLHFALDALIEEWGVEVTDEDLTEELQRIAAESGSGLEFVEQAAALQPDFAEETRDRVARRKLLDEIIASADIEEVPAEEYAEAEGTERAPEEPQPEQAPLPIGEPEVAEESDEAPITMASKDVRHEPDEDTEQESEVN